jgi:hypothetical protein
MLPISLIALASGLLAAGGATMLTVSFVWYGSMMLVPAGSRPWVGDTTDNSWFSLIFGANGFGRVSGEGAGAGPGGGAAGGGGFGGSAGLLRLFNPIVGGQIAWLLPLAALPLQGPAQQAISRCRAVAKRSTWAASWAPIPLRRCRSCGP